MLLSHVRLMRKNRAIHQGTHSKTPVVFLWQEDGLRWRCSSLVQHEVLSLFAQVMHITSESTRGASPFSVTYICTSMPSIVPFFPSLGLLKGAKFTGFEDSNPYLESQTLRTRKDHCDYLVQPLHFINKAAKPLEKDLVCDACLQWHLGTHTGRRYQALGIRAASESHASRWRFDFILVDLFSSQLTEVMWRVAWAKNSQSVIAVYWFSV